MDRNADLASLAWRGAETRFDGPAVAAFGTDAPEGLFARWAWDGETFTAEVDRYGFFSLFYCIEDGRLSVSPNILRLVEHGCSTAPDRRALAVFHRLGVFINDDTPFRAIRTLPPGGKLTWRDGEARVTAAEPTPHAQQITRDAAVEGMIELFRQAVSRALDAWDGEIVLPLSGGRDSRHILLELAAQGRPPERCVTFHHGGTVPNGEALAARALAQSVGVPHDMLGHHRLRFDDGLRAVLTGQLCADEHMQMMPLRDSFLASNAAAFDGIAGDILTNPDNDAERFYQHAQAGDFHAIARELFAGHARVISASGAGAGPLYSPGHDEEATAYLADAIARYADAPDPYQMFWLLNRTRREINFVPTGILAPAPAVFCPYLDRDFVEFCISLPYSVTRDQQLHNDAIRIAYPAHADVPFNEGFANAPPARPGPAHKARTLASLLRVARIVAPGHAGAMAKHLVRGGDLNRNAQMMYALHAACLDGLDAAKARRLLDAQARLDANRPRALVTDHFAPGQA